MKRKKYSKEFKTQVVKEAAEVGNASIVARKHDLSPSMVNRWVRQERGSKNPISMTNIRAKNSSSDDSDMVSEENYKLKKIIGEKELEIEILRDLLKKTDPAFRKK